MMRTTFFALVMLMVLFCGSAAAENALMLETKIPLGDVRGRIDHMTVDLSRHRLFVAELENDAIAVVDLQLRKLTHAIMDVSQPQGLAYVALMDTLFAANGGDGSLRLFQGDGYHLVSKISLGEDADNIRVDVNTSQVFVSYGNGGFAIVDAFTRSKVGEIAVKAHPQGFQLDEESKRIYANLPKEQAIIVVDYAARKVISEWQMENGSNFPLALRKSTKHVLVAFRDPPKFAAFTFDGSQLANTDTCGDADDMFIDTKRNRIYISCGEGFLDVFDAATYQRIDHIATMRGARTSLFVPELDRLFLAVRASPEEPAAVWIFQPH